MSNLFVVCYVCLCVFLSFLSLSLSLTQIEKQGEFLEKGVQQWEELDRVAAPLVAFLKDLEKEIASNDEFGSILAECEKFQQKLEVHVHVCDSRGVDGSVMKYSYCLCFWTLYILSVSQWER